MPVGVHIDLECDKQLEKFSVGFLLTTVKSLSFSTD